ncbi:MAG: GNAT family N-acetyltransferase [Thiotrichaceae bacterium]
MEFTIKPITEHLALLNQVIKLGDANKKYLGFFAEGAFKDVAKLGHILIAVNNNNKVLGYLLYRVVKTKNQVSIVHLCVDARYRKKNIANKLVQELKNLSKEFYGISLYCRRDYDSNSFWPNVGFAFNGEKKGRGRDKKDLTHYWYDHGHPDIFSFSNKEKLDNTSINAVIDANIFFNLHDSDVHPLQSDWITEEDLVLSVTQELFKEINRDKKGGRRRSAIAAAHQLPKVECNEGEKDKIYQVLRTHYPENISVQDESDIQQVSYAAAAQASCFVTNDSRLRNKLKNITEEVFSLSIITDTELIVSLDELLNKEQYKSVKLSGTKIEITLLNDAGVENLVEIFHRVERVKKAAFRNRLEEYLLYPYRHKTYTLSINEKPIAVFVLSTNSHVETEIPLFSISEAIFSPFIEFQLFSWIIREAVKEGVGAINFTVLTKQERTLNALIKNGFIEKDNGSWVKFNIPRIHDLKYISPYLITLKVDHEKYKCALADVHVLVNNASDSLNVKDLLQLEKTLWPLKISSVDIPSYIVPIDPVWAMELFDTKLAESSLLESNTELMLQIQNVYYRSAHTKLPKSPARVLWYVSKGKGSSNWKNGSSIRACSYIEDVNVGTPKELFKVLAKLGVYNWRDVLGVADGKIDKQILAFHFSRTELFNKPVPLSSLMEITGKKSAPFSPRFVDNNVFSEIYTLGMEADE